MKKLLTGNEAIARGAYEAGVKFASAYPGTPSTEILENIATYKEDILAEWAPNEKVALEAVIGASIAGARAMASMKHVGVNVAADPLFTYAYTGVNGGMVLVTADEPGQHSSQNEQDNRNYAKFAKIAMLEPADSQEAKDMIKTAFTISEGFDTPVLVRMTTRVCHSKGIVECKDREEVGIKEYVKNVRKYVTVPANARVLRVKVEERLKKLQEFSNTTELNYIEWNSTKIGVIASGGCCNYAREVFGDSASYLKLGFTHPLPTEKIKEFCHKVEKVYVIEENDPYIEEQVRLLGFACSGKDLFPFCGELTPDVIRKAVYGKENPSIDYDADKVVPRPPTFCAGCPHRGFFYTLGKRKNILVSGDIGCYTLGFAEPYNAMDYNICMGASISAGHGAQQIFSMQKDSPMRVVAVLGDSTFFHTGVTSLLDVTYNQSNTITVILDNRITGMTGHQENPGSGYTLQGKETIQVDIEKLVRACGINQIRVINPNDLKAVEEALDWALSLNEPSVIITRWPCVLKKFSPQDKEEFKGSFTQRCAVDPEVCVGCRMCLKTGCPAVSFDKTGKKANIGLDCVGCEVCLQVCPKNAIHKEEA
ncbi:indolepyruvate ferredoxin oxidoreductase subunit alpha [Sporomusa acidovorans]|uniref:Indolepyruvate oxidoreductase subunit IorA n=1 Tax=Sporomusa acidovorans (strain ATCC 49682 / DSM 3132 / Mol) TaxID=1123286 RepID=A0ABZ3JAE4_SPOA4|nr:indolepyruvate ferredoxin oxidoreductase subunit alpha [Sporomusa acidovorans]OZC13261.1 indolepyruvate ferredoxin oxidoreductase [Sporomusa acidovorans DSM 3132]SDD98928.1 indolepyruvate ferredoxin oxidoreductase alpha subunit [Sporomusa acidovorans]